MSTLSVIVDTRNRVFAVSATVGLAVVRKHSSGPRFGEQPLRVVVVVDAGLAGVEFGGWDPFDAVGSDGDGEPPRV
ncbi:hypothetical protein TUM20983_50600 [Mycobacterium antarcticum]|nr:hypothetical protein TUM20983_50600 [Mycolicibacterium sp. TUM20983]